VRVLVVDDMRDQCETLAALLRLWGHEPCIALDGPSALAAASSFHPGAVLLDICVPGMSGYEVARRLRALDGGDQFLLVAVSGYGSVEDLERSRAAGFDAHFIKPPDLDELQALLDAAALLAQPRDAAW
jgi:CheY-like chemotaxis protein